MQSSPNKPTSKPGNLDAEQSDAKVVRLIPRRPETKQVPDTPTHDDDDDPGPSAA